MDIATLTRIEKLEQTIKNLTTMIHFLKDQIITMKEGDK